MEKIKCFTCGQMDDVGNGCERAKNEWCCDGCWESGAVADDVVEPIYELG